MSSRRLTSAIAICLIVAACGSSTSSPTAAAAKSAAASTAPSPTFAEAAPCTKRALKFDPANIYLTGAWLDDDKGIYYIRQHDKIVWWSGMSGQAGVPANLGRGWTNVATGPLNPDMTIHLNWVDVPRGQVMGSGTLVWKVVDDGSGNVKLTKISETGSEFGASEFLPCEPG